MDLGADGEWRHTEQFGIVEMIFRQLEVGTHPNLHILENAVSDNGAGQRNGTASIASFIAEAVFPGNGMEGQYFGAPNVARTVGREGEILFLRMAKACNHQEGEKQNAFFHGINLKSRSKVTKKNVPLPFVES